jgi:phosphatidylserine synthase
MVFVTTLDFEMAFLFCVFGYFLDFFDGFWIIESFRPLGLELDSLADMVTWSGTRICDVFYAFK